MPGKFKQICTYHFHLFPNYYLPNWVLIVSHMTIFILVLARTHTPSNVDVNAHRFEDSIAKKNLLTAKFSSKSLIKMLFTIINEIPLMWLWKPQVATSYFKINYCFEQWFHQLFCFISRNSWIKIIHLTNIGIKAFRNPMKYSKICQIIFVTDVIVYVFKSLLNVPLLAAEDIDFSLSLLKLWKMISSVMNLPKNH